MIEASLSESRSFVAAKFEIATNRTRIRRVANSYTKEVMRSARRSVIISMIAALILFSSIRRIKAIQPEFAHPLFIASENYPARAWTFSEDFSRGMVRSERSFPRTSGSQIGKRNQFRRSILVPQVPWLECVMIIAQAGLSASSLLI
jgi:hypothetical protein